MACGILVPQPGIEPAPLALEVQNLNHWTAREVPLVPFLVNLMNWNIEHIEGCSESLSSPGDINGGWESDHLSFPLTSFEATSKPVLWKGHRPAATLEAFCSVNSLLLKHLSLCCLYFFLVYYRSFPVVPSHLETQVNVLTMCLFWKNGWCFQFWKQQKRTKRLFPQIHVGTHSKTHVTRC